MTIITLIITVTASLIGSICGIGGGIIMKPLFDLFGIASVSTISFLSGIAVLAMSGYNSAKNLISKENTINYHYALPLGLGAAAGGICGKYLFEVLKSVMSHADSIGAVQAAVLAVISIITAVYTINKSKIRSYNIDSPVISLLIGLLLGIISSFLGIGGGPINLFVLFFLFSMNVKDAVQSSLFIILLSQISSLFYTVISKKVPDFEYSMLLVMIFGGIAGGIAGKKIGKKIDEHTTSVLFVIILFLIVVICCFNFIKYASV